MAYIVGVDRNQTRMITTSLDDLIDKDNSVRVIDAEQIELTEEIKEKLIDKVNVYSDNKIEICWNFDSGFFDLETMNKCG